MNSHDSENMMISAMLMSILSEYARRVERGEDEATTPSAGFAINVLGGAAVEIGALSVEQVNDAIGNTDSLPPDRGIAADLITARLTIQRAVDGHDDADLPAAAAMIQRVIDRLELATP